MSDLLEKGYVRKLLPEEVSVRKPREWYLPHFGVVNPNKPGKLRLVFDLAAKSRGVSLNDYLLTGPDLLLSIVAVLWRFRKYKFAFAADIKEMFLRFTIPEDEIHSQRFYWRGLERTADPEVYAVVVVCFGATSSPCNANYCKIRNSEDFKEEFPEAHKMVVHQSYMDDYMGGADTEDATAKLVLDLIEVHRRGSMELCNWTANSKHVLSQIPSNLKAAGVKDLSPESDIPVERVLGMHWDPQHDFFTFKLNYHKVAPAIKDGSKIPTKRQVLQLIMSVFDPLGIVGFFVIKGRILLQDIWKVALGWDEQISGDYATRWKKWVMELPSITSVQIPRCYSFHIGNSTSVQLHTFCDASEQAYSAVAYLRFVLPDGAVEVAFVSSKCRVAPLKQLSIPRLELQAALLAVRLSASIKKEIQMEFSGCWYWSDSMTVLGWLRSESRRLNQYVANRVGEILESTNPNEWRWIPTKENVSDDATRDNKPCDFSKTSRWFNGPPFLKTAEAKWPQEKNMEPRVSKDEGFVGVIRKKDTDNSYLPDPSRFSSYWKLIRSTAWMLRFIARCQGENKNVKFSKWLTPTEIAMAELQWYKKVQTDCFEDELKSLKKQEHVHSSSKLYLLSPFLDKNGLIVLKGRIDKALGLDDSVKRPIFLDPKHQFTQLLVKDYHLRMNHQGQETVVNELRQKFWIFNIRQAVKLAFRNCQYCKKRDCQPIVQEMGELPQFRLFKKVRPFSYSGLDYFGPLVVKVGKRAEKRYGVIFTCMSTRAIHLELAKSLEADSAINAVRRFISRRGPPLKIFSDNATNFTGAAAELKKALKLLDMNDVMDSTLRKGIAWIFNPPAAPHMGGSWERLIRSVKTALKSSLKDTVPTEDTLQTFLVEVENVINSRPLTHVSIDPRDPESLTPNHFLLGSSCGIPSPGILTDSKSLKKQWRHTQMLTDRFWQRWVKEYLPTLARRTKWTKPSKSLEIGDVVVIADSSGPRNSWPLGRVVNTYPGKDGKVRVVDVKTKDGVFRRPVIKLCKLDVEDKDDKDESSSPYGG